MEDHADLIETLMDRVEDYSKTTFELTKLKMVETAATAASAIIAKAVTNITLALFALILNIGLALWLGKLLGETYYGFFAIAGLYGLAALISHFFLHKWIKKPVGELIIAQALNK